MLTNLFDIRIYRYIFLKDIKKIALKMSKRILNIVDDNESFANIARSDFTNILNGNIESSDILVPLLRKYQR